MIDDDAEQTHYDLSGWSVIAQSMLVERLAEAGIEHSWHGTELVVAVDDESIVDALIDDVEASPVEVISTGSNDEVEYDLVSWSDFDRVRLSSRLSDALVPFRWEGSVLVVPTAHESDADKIIDADLLESD